jgi:hypothetical protein
MVAIWLHMAVKKSLVRSSEEGSRERFTCGESRKTRCVSNRFAEDLKCSAHRSTTRLVWWICSRSNSFLPGLSSGSSSVSCRPRASFKDSHLATSLVNHNHHPQHESFVRPASHSRRVMSFGRCQAGSLTSKPSSCWAPTVLKKRAARR